ncbi:MAG: hypothetical protein ACK4IX_12570, partial [Candidatus Sericytochromatia bacterium]
MGGNSSSKMKISLKIWRQKSCKDKGQFVNYTLDDVNPDMSFLEMIDLLNENLIKKNPYYKSGDLIGKQGVEESYEDILRVIKVVTYIQKDKYNREIG